MINTVHGEGRLTSRPMRILAILACVGCALAAAFLAYVTYMDVAMIGFPDGHVTDYGAAVGGPLGVLAWVEAGFVLLFVALACSPDRLRVPGLLIALVAFAAVVLVARVGVPWYFGTHLGLDNGIGG